MKKVLFPVLIFTIILTACSSNTPAPTATPLPTNTVLPTETIVPTSTEALLPETLTELPPEMTDKYLSQFEKCEKGTKLINSVDTNVIFGIKHDGTKQVIAMEMDIVNDKGETVKRMTRVGEYTDKAGYSYYTYMGNSAEGRFSVTGNTSKILFGEPEGVKDVNMWNSLAKQLGFATAEEARDYVMTKKDGKLQYNVPYGERQGINTKSLMHKLPYPANFNMPIEINTIVKKKDFDALPDEIKSNLSLRYGETDMGAEFIVGRLIWTDATGRIIIYSINTILEVYASLDPQTMSENNKKYTNQNLEKAVSNEVLRVFDLLDDGYHNEATYKRQARYLFEIDGLTFKGTSQ